MAREVEVFGRVLVLRFIAATYVPAREAFPEMYPLAAGPDALLAAFGGGDHALSDLIGVCTPLSPEHPNEPPNVLPGSRPRLPKCSLRTRRRRAWPGTVKGNGPVVAIGVGRRGVGRDNGSGGASLLVG